MGSKDGLAAICSREIGLSGPRLFARRFSASERDFCRNSVDGKLDLKVIVRKLNLYGKLKGHKGCVNTVEFNSTGDLLVSGSDDKQVMFWDWASHTRRLSYAPGHHENIFQARIMPFTDDRHIVTSSGDGQIRLGQVLDDGQVDTTRLGTHEGHVYKLAVEPGSPHIFYSCGEDGLVQHFDLRSNFATTLLCCTSLTENNKQRRNRVVSLNAIVIDPRNPHYFAVGGAEEFARVYDIRKCWRNLSSHSDEPVDTFCPVHLVENNNVHVTGLAYSYTSELLVSYNDDLIYLFQKNMGLGPRPSSASLKAAQELEQPQVYVGHRNSQTIKGVSFFGPNDDYVLSGSDCGHIFIWSKKGAKLVRLMKGDQRVVNHIEPHPHMPFFATCGIESNVKLWTPVATDVSPLPENVEKIVESNRRGREYQSRVVMTPDVIMHVLRLQRRQTMAFVERRYNTADIESGDEGNAVPSVLGSSDGNGNAVLEDNEEDSAESSGDCNIS
ncbi:WD repeat containing protein [Trema orientale]|uniref:WD repeat containing protein n=1 Tax=Trema orientale TaxID=63057 RepID=A0A2P5FUS4_TREOI|nr:WD repeat containing protein [Trema orientale]